MKIYRQAQRGSVMLTLCIITALIMVSSVTVFSVILFTRQTTALRIHSAQHLQLTQSFLHYAINTIRANTFADEQQTIIIKIPEVPGMGTETFGKLSITGKGGQWHIQSELLDTQVLLCSVSCDLSEESGHLTIKNWQRG